MSNKNIYTFFLLVGQREDYPKFSKQGITQENHPWLTRPQWGLLVCGQGQGIISVFLN